MSEYTIPHSWAPFIQEDSELFLAFLCIIFQFTYCSSKYHACIVHSTDCFIICFPTAVFYYKFPHTCAS